MVDYNYYPIVKYIKFDDIHKLLVRILMYILYTYIN